MAVDRYADDGVNSKRTIRLRYDVPPPKDGELPEEFEGGIAAARLRRSSPEVKSRTDARAKAASRR
jgi:hypothetical protein